MEQIKRAKSVILFEKPIWVLLDFLMLSILLAIAIRLNPFGTIAASGPALNIFRFMFCTSFCLAGSALGYYDTNRLFSIKNILWTGILTCLAATTVATAVAYLFSYSLFGRWNVMLALAASYFGISGYKLAIKLAYEQKYKILYPELNIFFPIRKKIASLSLSRFEMHMWAFVTLSLLWFAYFYLVYRGGLHGDYGAHAMYSGTIATKHELQAPHFFMHGIAAFISKLYTPANPELPYGAIIFLTSLFQALLVFVFAYAIKELTEPTLFKKMGYRVYLFSLALMFVAPISILTFPRLYLGYIGINPYHNPTVIGLKPIAVLQFVLISKYILSDKVGGKAAIFFLTIASLLTKPNFMICLLPAIYLTLAAYFLRKDTFMVFMQKSIKATTTIVLPSLLVLFWQYRFFFVGNTETSGIVWAPFEVLLMYSPSGGLLWKFFLSILFPLAVAVSYPKYFTTHKYFGFAWVLFLVSAFFYYFLAEGGGRMHHGNFGWGSQVCLLVLFIASFAVLLSKTEGRLFPIKEKMSYLGWRYIFCLTAASLHLVNGILFFFLPKNY